ncbi:endopeptidase La [Candidatus Kapabacteria bacterium]|nr:endopeptidase La [Candidatus Kapabacteria bacterium]
MAEEKKLIDKIEENQKQAVVIPKNLSVLPLRDIIIYPNMIFPILIGRASTLKAVAEAVEKEKFVFVSSQKNPDVEDPGFDDIYKYGTIAKIIQVLRLPNNLLKVLVEGLFQGKVVKTIDNKDYLEAEVTQIENNFNPKDKELKGQIRHTSILFKEYIQTNNQTPPEIYSAFENIDDPLRKLYYAAANVLSKIEKKQEILETKTLKKQYFKLSSIISEELEMLKIEEDIEEKVMDSIHKTQRKFYVQEQIRALQKELGEDEELSPELIHLKKSIDDSKLPDHVKLKTDEEFDRLKKTPSLSPEFGVSRNYLETIASLPWYKKTEDHLNIDHVKKILDEDHYDLLKPKERILEFISVLNLAGNLKRQIICLAGPPGVGKTSLAKSIANALGRKFVRFSLGGVRDEAEIRGHRKTYIGAMPGKIIQSMKKAGTVNPVILLDEIDKMTTDFRGDPSSALLEVLDPEQNANFTDHFLEVEYDLSNVMFITTANVKFNIPEPLLDRMEVIDLSSYLDPDKLEIAKRHIIPKLKKEYGIEDFSVEILDSAIMKIIEEYTREAGVRNLERNIASIYRKLAKDIVTEYDNKRKSKSLRKKALHTNPYFKSSFKDKKFIIDEDKIEEYLKVPRFKKKQDELLDKIGEARGLAWTSVGGDTMPVEVNIMPGAEKLTLTGMLGDVMKESATAALSFVRSNYKSLKLPEGFNQKKEIHIHVPEGAIPKDGPSAGITMALALISAAAKIPIRGDLAMTGEIDLRGDVMPIGGLNEKLLAANKLGIKTVFIPADNEKDLVEINEKAKEGLEIIPIKHVKDALPIAFKDWGKHIAKKKLGKI